MHTPQLDQFIHSVLIDYIANNEALPKIPLFRWRRIYTTNFDLLLEQAYEDTPKKFQNLCPIYSSQDRQDFSLGPDVPYFKLHGCITKISPKSSLVLTPQDYAGYKADRVRLFNRLQDDLSENTILFIGYSLADKDFHQLFFDVRGEMNIKDFPRCYAVAPGMPNAVIEMWRDQKIEILDMPASEFFEQASKIKIEPYNLPKEQQERIEMLSKDAAHVADAAIEVFKAFELVDEKLGYETTDHVSFYQGNKPNWSVIRSECDAPRTFYDQIMTDVLVKDEAKRVEPFEMAVITAEAGAGKSTLLMRLCSAAEKLDRIKPGLREDSALQEQLPQTPPV